MTNNTRERQKWLDVARATLRGRPYASLLWEDEGIVYSPFFTDDRERRVEVYSTRSDNRWVSYERIIVKDAQKSNKIALEALEGGCSGLYFEVGDDTDFDVLLGDIRLDWIHTVWNAEAAPLLARYVEQVAYSVPDDRLIFLPNGYPVSSIQADRCADVADRIVQYHLRSSPSALIALPIVIGDQFYKNVATLRAARYLVDRIDQLTDRSPSAHIIAMVNAHAVDGRNEHDIKISSTVQAMAAALGGADGICIAPSDHYVTTPSDKVLNRRIARNIHHLLTMESYMDQVVDSVAGSYFFDQYSEDVARQIWSVVQRKLTENEKR